MKKVIAFLTILLMIVTACDPYYGSSTTYTIQKKVKKQGKGYVIYECWSCEGKKKIVCPSCKGYGVLACQKCGGSGEIQVDWEEFRTCSSCNGTGKGSGCNKCLMEGIITCPTCNGKGEIKETVSSTTK